MSPASAAWGESRLPMRCDSWISSTAVGWINVDDAGRVVPEMLPFLAGERAGPG